MPRPPCLSPAQVAGALEELPLWTGDPTGLHRSVDFASFSAAVAALRPVAEVADAMDHHPDVDLRWRTLHLTLVSHSAGGVSELDLELARRIDVLFPG